MNKTRMLELADAIEAAPKQQFNMHSFVGKFKLDKAGRRRYIDVLDDWSDTGDTLTTLKEMSCGTSACIAGWAVHLHPRAGLAAVRDFQRRYGFYDVEKHAKAILDLTTAEAETLFYSRMNQTNKQAAAFIRHCVELGTVPERRSHVLDG